MAMNFVACVIVIVLGVITSSIWHTAWRKGLLFERKKHAIALLVEEA